ncbi:uncharacterized protein [Penaeus vannamei]|uniref:uncharacterized protein isoform X4 n=1 Tax=Penaeus vannamei TaxID=6689 RepID=UPI00387F659B
MAPPLAPWLSLALALVLFQRASSGITISSPSAPPPPPPPLPLPSHPPHPRLSSLSPYPSSLSSPLTLPSSPLLPSPPSPPHPSLSSPLSPSPLLPSPPSPPHPSLSSPLSPSPLLPSPPSPPHPSLSSPLLPSPPSPPHPPLSSPLSPSPLLPSPPHPPLSSPPSPPPSPPLPPVSTHTVYHASAIALNQVTLAKILQELRDRDFLSQDTGFRRVDAGTPDDPQLTQMSHLNHLNHLNHLATIAQGIQHMSTSVDNLTHVLSSVILHIYPDKEVRERPSKILEGSTVSEDPSSDVRNRTEDLWMSEEQEAMVDWNVGAEILNLERKNEETREKIRQAEERMRELRTAVEERAVAVKVEGDENIVLEEILGDLAGSGAGRSSALLQDVEALKHAVADALRQKQSLQDASRKMRERNAWLTSRGEQEANRRRRARP